MSVVNRMLLDIDRRHGAAEVQTQGPFPDIRSVPPAAKPPARGNLAVVVLIAFAVGLTAAVLRYTGVLDGSETLPPKAPAPARVAAMPAAPLSPPPVAPLAQPAAGAPLPAAAATSPPAPTETPPLIAAPKEAAARVSRQRATPAVIESFKLSRQLSPVEERVDPLPQPTPRAAMAAPATAAKTAPLRQVAADETVAAARALWNDGARAGALATLREALAVAEAARNPAATPIARELARLEVADNRPQVALDLLRRFEGALADDAEAWALRGNAEQRLALHADSARSYLAAVRLRPAEGRWMLGAAISLAAEGRPDEAQGWAERARERGAVTAAMETYLQQLGVAARR